MPHLRRRSGHGFLPSPGRITHLRAPAGPGIRDDRGAERRRGRADLLRSVDVETDRLGPTIGRTAMARMRRALREYDVRGIETTMPFFRGSSTSRTFSKGASTRRISIESLHRATARSFDDLARRMEDDARHRRGAAPCAACRAARGRGRPAFTRSGRAGSVRPARMRCDDRASGTRAIRRADVSGRHRRRCAARQCRASRRTTSACALTDGNTGGSGAAPTARPVAPLSGRSRAHRRGRVSSRTVTAPNRRFTLAAERSGRASTTRSSLAEAGKPGGQLPHGRAAV